MKKNLTFLILLFSYSFYSQAQVDSVLIPCVGNKTLNSKTSEADLIKIFGSKNFKRVERWYEDESEKIIGTVFFKDSPAYFFIKWKDTVNFKNPEWIDIHGDQSLWRLDNGINIGTTLSELVELNGKNFTFSGFDWDYGGYATFEKGNLENDCYSIRLYYDYKDLFENEWNQIVGDKQISTNNSILKKVKVYVDEIVFYFK